jgi:hypothetical protein
MSMMIVDPYRFAAAGIARDIVVQGFSSGTSTGVQTITNSNITGVTPKGAITLIDFHDLATPGDESAQAAFSLGAMDATLDQCIRGNSTDNLASTSGGVANEDDYAIHLSASGIDKEAAGALVSGGVEYNFASNGSFSAPVAYMAFAGSGTSCVCSSVSLGTGTSAIDVTTPGFEPDAVMFFTAAGAADAASTGGLRYSFGFATPDGTQICLAFAERGGLGSSNPKQVIITDAAAMIFTQPLASTAAVEYAVTTSDFDVSGFSVTPSASATSDILPYIAIQTGRGCKIVEFTTPTSTGSATITGAGFTPQAAIVVTSSLEATNIVSDVGTRSPSALQAGVGIALVADNAKAFSWRVKAAADPTVTKSFSGDFAVLGADDNSAEAITATFTAWTSDGMQVNYTAVTGTAKRGFILFME